MTRDPEAVMTFAERRESDAIPYRPLNKLEPVLSVSLICRLLRSREISSKPKPVSNEKLEIDRDNRRASS